MDMILSDGSCVIVDSEDYLRVCNFNWRVHKDHGAVYARIGTNSGGVKRTVRLHQVILQYCFPLVVDHINGNGLDNRKENLRLCTNTENIRNAQRKPKGASSYRGVHFSKNTRKWCAKIRNGGEAIILGYFDDEREAAIAYDLAAKQYHGEFATTNNIDCGR